MTCFFCRGNAEQTTTEYIEKIDNFVVVIKNVPCEKCTQCGEEYFSNETVETLEKILDSVKTFSSSIKKKISLPAPTGRGNRIKCIYTHVSRSPRSV